MKHLASIHIELLEAPGEIDVWIGADPIDNRLTELILSCYEATHLNFNRWILFEKVTDEVSIKVLEQLPQRNETNPQ